MSDAEADRAFVLVVYSRAGTAFEVDIDGANPMHVFHHPYAYRDQELAA